MKFGISLGIPPSIPFPVLVFTFSDEEVALLGGNGAMVSQYRESLFITGVHVDDPLEKPLGAPYGIISDMPAERHVLCQTISIPAGQMLLAASLMGFTPRDVTDHAILHKSAAGNVIVELQIAGLYAVCLDGLEAHVELTMQGDPIADFYAKAKKKLFGADEPEVVVGG